MILLPNRETMQAYYFISGHKFQSRNAKQEWESRTVQFGTVAP